MRPKIECHDVSRGIIKSLMSMKARISFVLESDMGANFAGLSTESCATARVRAGWSC
ncbi:hypothetical protein ACVWZZ_005788 [Bradyrhizobium sp. LM6.10]